MMYLRLLCFLVLVAACTSPAQPPAPAEPVRVSRQINGVSFVAPRRAPASNPLNSATALGANWVAVIPYAFTPRGGNEVAYNYPGQYWGEQRTGVAQSIAWAHRLGLKVLLKPHVWVVGQGWAGDFRPGTEAGWRRWEATYADYILDLARLADSTGVEMFCLGCEYRQAAKERPQFWRALAGQVRQAYNGPLTYAANWDNYQHVTFWDTLDYLGVDAYFPLVATDTPSVAALRTAWQAPRDSLRALSERYGKPVLFTEYGYRSVDATAGPQWQLPSSWRNEGRLNWQGQSNAYEALLSTVWSEPWCAGGFLWKWYAPAETKAAENTGYTPQGKPAEAVIRRYYGQ